MKVLKDRTGYAAYIAASRVRWALILHHSGLLPARLTAWYINRCADKLEALEIVRRVGPAPEWYRLAQEGDKRWFAEWMKAA